MARSGQSRRGFLSGTAHGIGAAALGGSLWAYLLQEQARATPFALRPPGALPEERVLIGAAIGMMHRGVIFGAGAAWVAILALFLFDLLLVRKGWCGHLCPLGAFFGVVGRVAWIRVRFDAESCTHCGECIVVCPEPQVLNLKAAAAVGMVASGDCTNCGRCIPICPEDSLAFAWRHRCGTGTALPTSQSLARR